jgi:hypothetical protein
MRAEQPEDIVWTNFGAGASAQLDLFFVANHSMDPSCGIRDKREQNSIEDEPHRPYRLLPISMRGPLSPRTDRPRLHLETNSRGLRRGCLSAGKGRKRMAKLNRRSVLRNSFGWVAAVTLARP